MQPGMSDRTSVLEVWTWTYSLTGPVVQKQTLSRVRECTKIRTSILQKLTKNMGKEPNGEVDIPPIIPFQPHTLFLRLGRTTCPLIKTNPGSAPGLTVVD